MKRITVGLVGYGLSGAIFHTPIIRTIQELVITKVASSNSLKVHKDLPDVSVVADPEKIFGDGGIDLVVICTPNHTHYELARMALLAGKHVVVEKPFVKSSAEADALIQLADERHLLLSVYQNRRWDNDFLTVKRCIESGLLGRIHTYEVHFDRYRPLTKNEPDRPGSSNWGILYGLGPHLIDQALCLFGSPTTVAADIYTYRSGINAADYFHIVLGYDRLRILLHSGSMVKRPGPRYQVHGDKGSVIKFGMDSQEVLLRQGKDPTDPLWGRDVPEWHAELTTEIDGLPIIGKIETVKGAWEFYYQSIVTTLTAGGAPPVLAKEAKNTIKVIEQAIQSNEERKIISFA